MNPIGVFVSAFLVSAFAGVAALLRSGAQVKVLPLVTSALNSGFLGLGLSLLWYTRFQENIYFLLGICVMAGLGGMATVELALVLFRKGSLNIRIGKDGESGLEEKKRDG